MNPLPHYEKRYRGRLAPSPTGLLHIGHARTFWIAARRAEQNRGALILRNEDLDPQRSRPEFARAIVDDLRWLATHLRRAYPELHIGFDLADTGGLAYYSGPRFTLYGALTPAEALKIAQNLDRFEGAIEIIAEFDDVMPRVWARRPAAHLYLVGRSPAPEVLARNGQRVHVTGEVASIEPYLRACTAAVVPLRWESGTRFKILEAFACRAPVTLRRPERSARPRRG